MRLTPPTNPGISCVLITKNAAETLSRTLESVHGWVNEIVIVDDESTDETLEIAKKYKARVYTSHQPHEGKQRLKSLQYPKNEWVLSLDSDEVVSVPLQHEIRTAISKKKADGYILHFQNHFLGRPVSHGGESYAMLRLFRKSKVTVDDSAIHSQFHLVKGTAPFLTNKLLHYSYRSIWQVYKKFTSYAIREARKKRANGESTSLKKITMYPAHMLYARFIEDNGYKDGLFRLPLDVGFAYMEFLTYFLMYFIKK